MALTAETKIHTTTIPGTGERLLAAFMSLVLMLSLVFPIAAVMGGLAAWLGFQRKPFVARHGLCTACWHALVLVIMLCLAVTIRSTHTLQNVPQLLSGIIPFSYFWAIQTAFGQGMVLSIIALYAINTLVALYGIIVALCGRPFLPMILRTWPRAAR